VGFPSRSYYKFDIIHKILPSITYPNPEKEEEISEWINIAKKEISKARLSIAFKSTVNTLENSFSLEK